MICFLIKLSFSKDLKKETKIVEYIKVLSNQSWVFPRYSKTFNSINELEYFLTKIIDLSLISKIIKKIEFSTLTKFHLVNFSASMTPSKEIRYFLRQNTLLRIKKVGNKIYFNSAVVNGRVTVNAYRSKYIQNKGWKHEWLPLPGNLITNYYINIQDIAKSTLSETIKQF